MQAPTAASSSPAMFYRDLLRGVRRILTQELGLKSIVIRPIDARASRLSLPLKITGEDKKGKKIQYFGKIIGSSDILTDRSMQLLKNVYLQIHAQQPLFGMFETAQEMAHEHFERLQAMHRINVPTAKPYGYYQVKGTSWFLVTEFLDARPISSIKHPEPTLVDTAFSYLHRMHRKRIYHGDLKPDNIMVGELVYILDFGHLRNDAPAHFKQAYDLACLLCCFLHFFSISDILKVARKYYSRQSLKDASEYIELVQMRPDIHFNDEIKEELVHALTDSS